MHLNNRGVPLFVDIDLLFYFYTYLGGNKFSYPVAQMSPEFNKHELFFFCCRVKRLFRASHLCCKSDDMSATVSQNQLFTKLYWYIFTTPTCDFLFLISRGACVFLFFSLNSDFYLYIYYFVSQGTKEEAVFCATSFWSSTVYIKGSIFKINRWFIHLHHRVII